MLMGPRFCCAAAVAQDKKQWLKELQRLERQLEASQAQLSTARLELARLVLATPGSWQAGSLNAV